MVDFAKHAKSKANTTKTENGAETYLHSGSAVLDLFSQGGAYCSRSEDDINNLVGMAAEENLLLTLKCLFYLRDIRKGQGERRFFRVAMKYLAERYPSDVAANLEQFPVFGRWDDLWLSLENTILEPIMLQHLVNTLDADWRSEKPSLLAKWMPSENASSKNTKRLAKKFMKRFSLSPRKYRQHLSALRAKLNVVEREMCAKRWEFITYSHVPSKAMLKYRKSYYKRDEVRFKQFIESVKKGEKKINASTLYPYDIVYQAKRNHDESLQALWDNLPNYMEGEKSVLVMCDSSASMQYEIGPKTEVTAHDVALSLAIYTAERNQGAYKNLYLTFSEDSEFVELRGVNLYNKIRNIPQLNVRNTNFQSAFDEILKIAIKNHLSQEDLPQTLLVISDMEFDTALTGNDGTYSYSSKTKETEMKNFEVARKKFAKYGFELPDIVYWNVMSRNNQSPVTKDENGMFMVSGCSPSILKNVFDKSVRTPQEMMEAVLNNSIYDVIKLAKPNYAASI